MRRLLRQTAAFAIAITSVAAVALGAHKKKPPEEPKPQVLPLPKELPRALATDPRNLTFHTTPLLKSGRLSAQIRESLASVIRDAHGGTVIRLRAFVSGAGDTRRVQEIVGDMFTEKKLNLPVLTIVQVGSVGEETSAIIIESVVSERRAVNPNGLVFLGGETESSLAGSLAKLGQTARGAGLKPADILSATCFTERISDYAGMRGELSRAFPQAALNLVQALRDPMDDRNTCEAVGRVPEGNSVAAGGTGAARRLYFANGPQIVFTGLQLSFGTYLADADSALSHLQRDVEALHTDLRDAISLNAYSLNPAAVSALEKTLGKFRLPPGTLTIQPVEGLPSLDAALGMDAVLAPATESKS